MVWHLPSEELPNYNTKTKRKVIVHDLHNAISLQTETVLSLPHMREACWANCLAWWPVGLAMHFHRTPWEN
jgi:hypothetical protein